MCFFVRFMCVGDLWGDQNKTSTWNKNISFWGRVPSALKTSNPVLKSTQCVCVTHKKIKTIYMKINNFSILKSKLENPSGLIDRIVVLIRLSRGNSKILRTDWMTAFWKFGKFDGKVTKSTVRLIKGCFPLFHWFIKVTTVILAII